MKKVIGIGLVLALVMFHSTTFAAEKVRLVLDWIIAGRHTPYYVALDKGHWRAGGLDVTISRGYGGSKGARIVASGGADIGFAGPGPALISRAKGAPLVIVSIFYGKAPFVIISKEKTGIRTPKDLEGKTFGASAGSSARAMFPALAKVTGINPGKVKWLTMSSSAYTASLLADKVDMVQNFLFDTIQYTRLDPAKHGQFSFLLLADHGFDVYGNGLMTTENYIRNQSRSLRTFVTGAVKGYKWTIQHPEEGNRIFMKHQPTLDRKIALAEIDILRKLTLTKEAKKHCIGWIDRDKLVRTRDIMFSARNVKGTVDIEQAYTTKFLPCG
jgi:NitT/TauT family transport system substrate-binding protein